MWLGVIIDILFVILLGASIYWGYKSGAVKVILDIAVILLIIPIVYFTYKPVTNFVIANTSIHEGIKSSVYSTLEAKKVNENETLEEDNGEYIPVLTKKINELITKAKEEKYNNVAEKVSEEIARFAVQIMVILAWSIILYIILTLIKMFIVKVVDIIPLVNVLNYAAGSVLQLAKTIILTFVVLYLLQFVLPVIKSTALTDTINKTNIIKYMYNNNFINNFTK